MTSERCEQEAKNTTDSKERTISYLQTEVSRLQERLKELHSESNESELRADQAIAKERGMCLPKDFGFCNYTFLSDFGNIHI